MWVHRNAIAQIMIVVHFCCELLAAVATGAGSWGGEDALVTRSC